MCILERNNCVWEIRKGDQEKNNDSTYHIHQHANTTIVSRHKPEDQIKSNKMLHLADTILWSRDMDNIITKSLFSRLDAFEMWVYRRVLTISWSEKITNDEVY